MIEYDAQKVKVKFRGIAVFCLNYSLRSALDSSREGMICPNVIYVITNVKMMPDTVLSADLS